MPTALCHLLSLAVEEKEEEEDKEEDEKSSDRI